MDELLRKAKQYAEELLKKEPIVYSNELIIPKKSGVYIINFVNPSDEAMVYVGEGKDLHKRLVQNHLSASENGENSVFRKKLNRLGIHFGEEMKDWIIENCLFSWIEIPDIDMCHLTEKLVIAHLRDRENLLND